MSSVSMISHEERLLPQCFSADDIIMKKVFSFKKLVMFWCLMKTMPTKTYGAGENVCCLMWIAQKIQRWKERRMYGDCLLGRYTGAVVIIHVSHHYDAGLIPGSYEGWDWLISVWLWGDFAGFSGFPPSAKINFHTKICAIKHIDHKPLLGRLGDHS